MLQEIKYLNPEKKSDGYKVHTTVGVWEQKKIDWELLVLAQKELKRAQSDVNFLPSEYACELWIESFGKRCPDAVLIVLENIIEPITPNAATVEWLYKNDKLDEKEIDSITANFLRSPLFDMMAKITDSQNALNETSPNTEEKTEPPEKTEQVTSDTSQENIGIS